MNKTKTVIVFMEIKGELTRIGKHKIFLLSDNEATIVRDGRPLVKKGDKWIYEAK